MNASRDARRLLLAAAPALALLVLMVAPLRAEEAKAEAKGGDKAALVGATTCLGCHTDKDAFHKNVHAKAMTAEKGVSFEESCESCHGPGAKHAGAGGDKNNPDFATIKNPKKLKPAELSETCLQCHSGGKRMHWLGSTHEAKNVQCTNCHSIHDAQANGGKEPLLAKKTEAEVCFQCHAEKKAQIRKSAHMPLVEGKMGCTGCHNPHGSNTDKLLAKASVAETCYQCHQDKRGPFLWEHPPVREDCLNCHDPHGSHNDYMLITKPPLLCQRCHVATRHPSNAYDLGTAQKFSNRLINQACVNCHSRIHGSNHPSGQKYLR